MCRAAASRSSTRLTFGGRGLRGGDSTTSRALQPANQRAARGGPSGTDSRKCRVSCSSGQAGMLLRADETVARDNEQEHSSRLLLRDQWSSPGASPTRPRRCRYRRGSECVNSRSRHGRLRRRMRTCGHRHPSRPLIVHGASVPYGGPLALALGPERSPWSVSLSRLVRLGEALRGALGDRLARVAARARFASGMSHAASDGSCAAQSARTSIVTLRTIQSVDRVRLRWSSSVARRACSSEKLAVKVLQDLGEVPLDRRLLDHPAGQPGTMLREPARLLAADLLERVAGPHSYEFVGIGRAREQLRRVRSASTMPTTSCVRPRELGWPPLSISANGSGMQGEHRTHDPSSARPTPFLACARRPERLLAAGGVDSLAMALPESATRLIRSGALGHLVTREADGSAQVSCVWVAVDGDDLLTAHLNPGQRKLANVRRDPRVALSFEGSEIRPPGLREYLIVHGRAAVEEGGAPSCSRSSRACISVPTCASADG